MLQPSLQFGVLVSGTLFAVGTIFAIVGLTTVHWITTYGDDDGSRAAYLYDVRIGLFEVCVEVNTPFGAMEDCTDDLESDDFDSSFKICRGCLIAGVIFGAGSVVGVVMIAIVNINSKLLNRIPLISAIISALLSVILLFATLIVFDVGINNDIYNDVYKDIFKEKNPFGLDYSFGVTCFAAILILIGCAILPYFTEQYLKSIYGPKYGLFGTTKPQAKYRHDVS